MENVQISHAAEPLESKDSSVRYFTLTDLLDVPTDAPEVAAVRARIVTGARVRALLKGQKAAKRVSDKLSDTRVRDALDIVASNRQPDGC